MEDYDIISHKSTQGIYGDWEKHGSARTTDSDAQIHAFLREHYPEMTITAIPSSNLPLMRFADAGFATAELDTKTDSILRWRGFVAPTHRGGQGRLGDAIFFAKYHYKWKQEDFIVYLIGSAFSQIQYILKEPGENEDTLSHCAKSDELIKTAIEVLGGNADEFVYVFDGFWTRSKELWEEVMKSSWDKVILDPEMKDALQDISDSFFDSKDVYDRYGVPWRRGLIFAGPPGNGKTISIKALMKTLYKRKQPIPTLYVKSAPQTFHLASVFRQARAMTPCLLVMEDIETIVTPTTRSYFFNEVDGLANNGGLLMVASTNYLDRLDPGLSKRPSRFDRKFIFPLPDEHERTLYAEFWREKLKKTKSDLLFPEKLCPAMAKITDKFSFAYMQEAFIATLLTIAREATKKVSGEAEGSSSNGESYNRSERRQTLYHVTDAGDPDPLQPYKLWRVFKAEVATLRKDMGSEQAGAMYHLPPPPPPTAVQSSANMEQSRAWPLPPSLDHPRSITGVPIREPKARYHVVDDDLVIDAEGKPDSLELASAGVCKLSYIASRAHEWRK